MVHLYKFDIMSISDNDGDNDCEGDSYKLVIMFISNDDGEGDSYKFVIMRISNDDDNDIDYIFYQFITMLIGKYEIEDKFYNNLKRC